MSRPPPTPRQSPSGFTLVELVIVIAVLGVLATIATTKYQQFLERARVASAIAEMQAISRLLDNLQIDGGELPATLAEVDAATEDPWGRPYEYLKIAGTLPPGQASAPSSLPPVAAGPTAQPRMDNFLVPINTDYDLYSRGADGLSEKQLDRNVSRDDVIRASNGSYFGLAKDF